MGLGHCDTLDCRTDQYLVEAVPVWEVLAVLHGTSSLSVVELELAAVESELEATLLESL